jgi:hypothetical protein
LAGGVPISKELSISKGSNGNIGSGGYIVNWNGDITGKEEILADYRDKGVAKTVWEHTMSMFTKIEKINKGRMDVTTS